jgi:hypothetical protein
MILMASLAIVTAVDFAEAVKVSDADALLGSRAPTKRSKWPRYQVRNRKAGAQSARKTMIDHSEFGWDSVIHMKTRFCWRLN